jgi:hypothetical protein
LTGYEHPRPEIDRFKSLLVELKYSDWPMEQRINRISDDSIGRSLLEEFLAASGEQALFGSLPSPTPRASTTPAGTPSIDARPSRLARLFRRK